MKKIYVHLMPESMYIRTIATMSKTVSLFLLVLSGILFFTRCSNDVDLYADYKEITIVYGLLDIDDDTTWIKITKAFTGPGNALIMAQNPDSSNYPYKLDAKLIGIKNGNEQDPIQLDTMTIYSKNEGDSVFYYPKQLMYYTTENMDVDAVYSLIVNTKENEITSEAPMIGGFGLSYPYNTIDFVNDHAIKWNSVKNGKRYEVTTIFHYQEYLPGTYDDTLNLSIEIESIYANPVKVSNDLEGGEALELRYAGDKFFAELDSELEKIANIQRWSGMVDVVISAGSEVLHYYIEINNSVEGSLLQELPQYTNIHNGTGIFASRHSVVKSVPLSGFTERKLVEDYNLGFKYKTK